MITYFTEIDDIVNLFSFKNSEIILNSIPSEKGEKGFQELSLFRSNSNFTKCAQGSPPP